MRVLRLQVVRSGGKDRTLSACWVIRPINDQLYSPTRHLPTSTRMEADRPGRKVLSDVEIPT